MNKRSFEHFMRLVHAWRMFCFVLVHGGRGGDKSKTTMADSVLLKKINRRRAKRRKCLKNKNKKKKTLIY